MNLDKLDAAIPEPPEGTFVCWFDPNNDPYAVFFRSDRYLDGGEDADRWYNASAYEAHDDGPMSWDELLIEMNGFRGPVELISNGELCARTAPTSGEAGERSDTPTAVDLPEVTR